MTSYLFIDDIWPEFAELLATRPIMIHEFHSTGMDGLFEKKYIWGLFYICNIMS